MELPAAAGTVALPELLAVLALGADLGMGQPMDHAMRQYVLASRIGERVGLGEKDRAALYYVSLMAWVGCHIDAYEQAKWFGDDLALKGGMRLIDPVGLRSVGHLVRQIGAGSHGVDRAAVAIKFVTGGARDASAMLGNHAYAADRLGSDLGVPAEAREAVVQTFERWDGKGAPAGTRGEAIVMAARIVNLADVLVVFHRAGGIGSALEVARQRSGTQFDPTLVQLVEGDAGSLFAQLDEAASWEAVLNAQPSISPQLGAAELDAALGAIGDFADLKSPSMLGHSRAVATLAEAAANAMSWSPAPVAHVRRAALIHDLGRLGVSNGIWDKVAPLTPAETERVRLHPYLTERMLAVSPSLAAYGVTASQHHERLDGSGYPRSLRGDAMSPTGRLLAVVDDYVGKLEPRPHREARPAASAADHLRQEVRAGRHDPEAVEAVLDVVGNRARRRRAWPAGLTNREVEVLRLLARGVPNKQMAEQLVITPKTVENHVEHIYTKIGVSNRARASLYAVRHGLVSPLEDTEDGGNSS